MKCARVFLLSTMTCLLGTATAIPQQPDGGPTWEVTSAWLTENIAARAGYAYSLTDTVTYNGPGLAHGSVDTKTGSESVSFRVTSNAMCHLNFSVNDRVTGNAIDADMNIKSFDIDLSQSNSGSIRAQPLDLRSFVTSNFSLVTLKDFVDVVEVTPAAPSYWEIMGLVDVAQDGRPTTPPSAYDDSVSLSAPVVFTDQAMATRVATALNHAVDLCGGKPAPAQPF